MNSIINQNRLLELMSQLSGRDLATCEAFVAAFTSAVREGLADYEEVNVPGFGRFALEGVDNKIVYKPSKQMAADVNAPFEMFVPEDLAPEVDDAELAAVDASAPKPIVEGIPTPQPWEEDEEPEQSSSQKSKVKSQNEAEDEHTLVPELEPEPEVNPEPEQGSSQKSKVKSQNEAEDEHTLVPEVDDEEPVEEPEEETYIAPETKPSKFWMIWALVIGFLLGLAVGFFVHDPIQEALEPSVSDEYDTEDLEAELNALAEALDVNAADAQAEAANAEDKTEQATAEQPKQDAPKAAENKPAAKPETKPATAQPKTVYDSVRSGYYLTTMAKKHYGYDKYWVYIYLENKSKITNPNRISTETKLVIPPLEKYAPGGDTPQNRAAAAQKEAEINRRFK